MISRASNFLPNALSPLPKIKMKAKASEVPLHQRKLGSDEVREPTSMYDSFLEHCQVENKHPETWVPCKIPRLSP
jgi:TATA-binding protein-associated factor Taf7